MSMSTGEKRHPRGDRLAIATMAVALATVGVWGAEPAPRPAPWAQDFEDRVPGQAPADWGATWGTPGDDLLLVSNLRAVGGRQALLLDRTGTNTEMWGIATTLPDTREGWLHVSFAFLVQGAGNDARFGFEIRERLPSGRRVVGLGFAASKVAVTPMSEAGAYLADQKVTLGAFEKDVWYRLELWLPAAGGPERRLPVSLSRYRGEGAWEEAGALIQVPAVAPAGNASYGQFMLVMTPGARGYRLFLDALQAEGVPTAPSQPLAESGAAGPTAPGP